MHNPHKSPFGPYIIKMNRHCAGFISYSRGAKPRWCGWVPTLWPSTVIYSRDATASPRVQAILFASKQLYAFNLGCGTSECHDKRAYRTTLPQRNGEDDWHSAYVFELPFSSHWFDARLPSKCLLSLAGGNFQALRQRFHNVPDRLRPN